MSVNIFGSSGKQSSKIDNKYVDRKFISLTTNLNSKMDKNGGSFSGNIEMGDNNITLTRTPISDHDVANKKYVNTAVNNHVLLTADTDSETKLDLKVSKSGEIMSGILNLGANAIKTTHTPISGE